MIFLMVVMIFVAYAIFATYNRSFVEKDFTLITEEDEEIDARTLEPVQ
jgi:hypothetical protein